MAVKPGSANRDNMQEAPNNAADSVGLMRDNQIPRVCHILLYTAKGHLRRDALSLKIGS